MTAAGRLCDMHLTVPPESAVSSSTEDAAEMVRSFNRRSLVNATSVYFCNLGNNFPTMSECRKKCLKEGLSEDAGNMTAAFRNASFHFFFVGALVNRKATAPSVGFF